MGLFSSRKKTVVGTSVIRVMDNDNVPQTEKRSLLQAITRGDGVVDTFIEDVLNGPVIKMERMYRSAKNGNYVYGLPNAYVQNARDGGDEVAAVIEGLEGEPVTLEYLRFAPFNPVHIGWGIITDDYGYNPATNELTTLSVLKGTPVYLDTMVSVFGIDSAESAEPGTLDNFSDNPLSGYSPERPAQVGTVGDQRLNPDVIIDPGGNTRVIIKYVWVTGAGIQRDEFTTDLSGYDTDKEYFQAKYKTASGQVGYFTYEDAGGTYPTLDAIHDISYTNPGTYFPFVLFRHHRTNRTAEGLRDTEEFKSTEKLLKIINMDFAEMGEQIHANPDIEDVDQAVMMLAVPANTTHQIELRYLYDFFSWLHSQSPTAGVRLDKYDVVTENAIVWRDSDYRMTMSYGGITRTIKAGTVAAKGKYQGALDSYLISQTVEELQQVEGEVTQKTYTQTVYEKILRYQINESLYEEIRITHPTMRYDIYKQYSYLGGADTNELVIPIDRDISNKYSLLDREDLYYRSLRFVFNSRVVIKVKWYETGIFRFFLTVAAIAITVFSLGKAYPLVAWAISIGAYALATALILITLLATVIQIYTYRVVVKELGVELGFVLAVTAAILGGGLGATGSTPGYLPDASTLLRISTNLSQAVNYQTNKLLAVYDSKTQAFNLFANEKQEELEEAMALLSNESFIDPFEFIGQSPLYVAGESPDNFYQRTIHSGNIGTVIYKSVESFVDISLTLPDVHTTVGDTLYE